MTGAKHHPAWILEDLSPGRLAQAVEANIFAKYMAFRRWPQAEVHDNADRLWTITGLPFPAFNSVLRVRLPDDQLEQAVAAIEAPYLARCVPMRWCLGPASQPARLGAFLRQRGYLEEESPGMAIDLALLDGRLPEIPGLTIEAVRSAAVFKEWSRAFKIGNEVSSEKLNDTYAACFTAIGFEPDALESHYLARLDGEAVAVSSMVIGAGVAGIYNVGTVHAARRKGIGAAITQAPLLEARARGYRAGVLFASEMGASVYRRMGFKEYCKIYVYQK